MRAAVSGRGHAREQREHAMKYERRVGNLVNMVENKPAKNGLKQKKTEGLDRVSRRVGA